MGAIVAQAVVACLALALVGGTVALVWLFVSAKPEPEARVGDCMISAADGRYELIDCADQSAAFSVVGRLDGRMQADAAEACKTLKEAAPEQAYWKGNAGEPGVVLCLKRKPKPVP